MPKNQRKNMENLIEPKELKSILNCSLSWIYKAAENGILPCVRIPCPGSGQRQKHLIRFKKEDILSFIEKHYGN